MDPQTGSGHGSEVPAAQGSTRALDPIERRIVGVLVEKAKTTPDQYPLTLKALVAGCNQKSNRAPQMQLEEDEVLEVLERLKGRGIVVEVHGGGRVPKYRHQMREWLGVEKEESAVVCELLLRGPQTLGELRAHVARMASIANVDELRPVLQRLHEKGLIQYLTPEGRGQVVADTLYPPETLEELKTQYAQGRRETPVAATGASSLRGSLAELTERLEALEQRLARLEERLGIGAEEPGS